MDGPIFVRTFHFHANATSGHQRSILRSNLFRLNPPQLWYCHAPALWYSFSYASLQLLASRLASLPRKEERDDEPPAREKGSAPHRQRLNSWPLASRRVSRRMPLLHHAPVDQARHMANATSRIILGQSGPYPLAKCCRLDTRPLPIACQDTLSTLHILTAGIGAPTKLTGSRIWISRACLIRTTLSH